MTNDPAGDYASGAFRAWSETQKAMLDYWIGMMSGVASSKPRTQPGNTGPDPGNIYALWSDYWNQNINAMFEGTSPILKAVMEQFTAAQEYSLRYLDFTNRVWSVIAAQPAGEGEIQDEIEATRQKMLQEWSNWPVSIFQDTNQLWNLYLAQWQQFGQPWMNAFQEFPAYQSRLITGDNMAMSDLSSLFRDTYQQTLGRFVSSPNLGPAREFTELVQQGFDAWVDWYLASLDYQSLLSETWQEAVDDFFNRLLEMAEKGERVESVRALMLMWTRGAEEIFTRTFREERYTLVQGKMLNAAMEYRKQQRMIMEEYLNSMDLPTRSELDETHRRVYELRKEVKQLKKEISRLNQEIKPLTTYGNDLADDQDIQEPESNPQAFSDLDAAEGGAE